MKNTEILFIVLKYYKIELSTFNKIIEYFKK